MRILLIEDDALIGEAIAERLGREHYSIEWVRDGDQADAALAAGGLDLAILDIGLPHRSGLDVLKAARSRGDGVPVLILTARDSVDDRIRGLNQGADDYLVKPFDMGELVARCRALSRRACGRIDNVLKINGIEVDSTAHTVHRDGETISLPPHELKVLRYLMERVNRVVSKDQLAEMLYGWDEGAESNTVEVYISQIRKKLGAGIITTIRGIGYVFR